MCGIYTNMQLLYCYTTSHRSSDQWSKASFGLLRLVASTHLHLNQCLPSLKLTVVTVDRNWLCSSVPNIRSQSEIKTIEVKPKLKCNRAIAEALRWFMEMLVPSEKGIFVFSLCLRCASPLTWSSLLLLCVSPPNWRSSTVVFICRGGFMVFGFSFSGSRSNTCVLISYIFMGACCWPPVVHGQLPSCGSFWIMSAKKTHHHRRRSFSAALEESWGGWRLKLKEDAQSDRRKPDTNVCSFFWRVWTSGLSFCFFEFMFCETLTVSIPCTTSGFVMVLELTTNS